MRYCVWVTAVTNTLAYVYTSQLGHYWSYRSRLIVDTSVMADGVCVHRQVAARPILMAAIAQRVPPSLWYGKYFLLPLHPHSACTLSTCMCPHHDGWGFHFVEFITEYYTRGNFGPCSTIGLDFVWREGGRTALIRHLAFPVWKARAHSSGVFVYWRHDDF